MVNEQSMAAGNEIHRYLRGLLERRKTDPQDDLLTALAHAGLSGAAAADFATLLLAAGTETVARLLGWIAVLLGANPDQRAALVADRSLIPNAVEELLRYEAPSPVQGRWTTRDVELHDTVIPANSKVLLLPGSAGRDERAYPDPDRVDVRRDAGGIELVGLLSRAPAPPQCEPDVGQRHLDVRVGEVDDPAGPPVHREHIVVGEVAVDQLPRTARMADRGERIVEAGELIYGERRRLLRRHRDR